jgi:adenylate cyclase
LARLKGLRREVIDPAIAAHRGRIVKTTGDGMLAEFASVVDAARAAILMQVRADAREAAHPMGRRIRFRVGLHLGDVIAEPDGDLFGNGVNVAARLEALAEPGGLCLSNAAYEQVRDRLPGVRFRDLGEHTLKNLARPLRVYAVGPQGAAAAAGAAAWGKGARALVLAGVAVLLLLLGGAGLLLVGMGADRPSRSGETGRPSLAVLPLANLSGEPGQDYFSDGITEDVIVALGRFTNLAVLSRNAVSAFKGASAPPTEVGRALGVRYVVEGSLRRTGERIRVQVQLADAAQGRVIWSQQFDEELKDLFDVQQRIARGVAGSLAASVRRIEGERALARPTDRLDAYDLVLRGRHLLARRERAANREARQLFERAREMDPGYAAAHALLSHALAYMAAFGWTEFVDETMQRAEALARHAVALDPENVEGHSALARIYSMAGRSELALAASEKALAVNPNDAESLFYLGTTLLWAGRMEDAIQSFEMVHRIDPATDPTKLFQLGLAYYTARRHEDATRVLERAHVQFPDSWNILAVLAASYGRTGKTDDAKRAIERLRPLAPLFDPDEFGSRFRDPEHRAYLREGLRAAGL